MKFTRKRKSVFKVLNWKRIPKDSQGLKFMINREYIVQHGAAVFITLVVVLTQWRQLSIKQHGHKLTREAIFVFRFSVVHMRLFIVWVAQNSQYIQFWDFIRSNWTTSITFEFLQVIYYYHCVMTPANEWLIEIKHANNQNGRNNHGGKNRHDGMLNQLIHDSRLNRPNR